jgi:chemotaxis protein histidine kinase CheA
MSVVVEDPSKLLQDIAHLKAKLKQKKTDRLAILNDIVDIDLNAPFDRLIPGTVVGDEIWCIIDRLKKRVCGGGIADYDSNHACSRRETSNLPHKLSASSLPTTNNLTPIFIRQQLWAKQREQKLLNARLQQEADAMDGITGVPQISDATQSWKRARESHDETLRRVAEEDAKKQQVREAKEKALREELAKETENKEVEVAAKTLIINEADNEERRKRIELLARPRQVRATFAASMESCSSKDEEYEQQHPPMDLPSKSKIFLSPKPKKKKQMTRAILSVHDEGRTDLASSSEYPPSNPTSVEKTPDKFCGMNSFAEMSDKEFAKLIKNIGKGQVIKR